jgi:chromosome segregation ATPase
MSRPGVDYQTVKHAAVKLLSQGTAPSVQKIREVLGTGSNSTLAGHLKIWREEYATKEIHHLPANMPKELITSLEVLWQTAMEQAQNQLAAYKQSLDNEQAVIQQAQQDAEKGMAELKQKLADISTCLENEVTEKQRLLTELAVVNERLEKKDNAFTAQKDHYEVRLKRVYEEKENSVTHNHQLQHEIKLWQEKLAAQVEQHQKLIAQQSALQEQSEKRWLNLIDQSNQATKETSKKLEALRHNSEMQIKKLNDKLTETQFDRHEKEAQLKVALAEIKGLKEAAKTLEADNVKVKSIVMKLKEDRELKNSVERPKKLQKSNRITAK